MSIPSKNSINSDLVTEKGSPLSLMQRLTLSSVTFSPHLILFLSFVRSNWSYSPLSISTNSIHRWPNYYLSLSFKALSDSDFVLNIMQAWPDLRPYSSNLYFMLFGIRSYPAKNASTSSSVALKGKPLILNAPIISLSCFKPLDYSFSGNLVSAGALLTCTSL